MNFSPFSKCTPTSCGPQGPISKIDLFSLQPPCISSFEFLQLLSFGLCPWNCQSGSPPPMSSRALPPPGKNVLRGLFLRAPSPHGSRGGFLLLPLTSPFIPNEDKQQPYQLLLFLSHFPSCLPSGILPQICILLGPSPSIAPSAGHSWSPLLSEVQASVYLKLQAGLLPKRAVTAGPVLGTLVSIALTLLTLIPQVCPSRTHYPIS